MPETFQFTDAVREAIPALIAIAGPSGSGKTYTALQLATGLADGGPIFGIDTENNRMKMYASDFQFKHLALGAPYDPERFVAAINAAVKAGAAAIVLDSCTPEWDGAGGVQEIVDQAMVRFKNNKFAAWGVGTPKHQSFLDALTHCPVHIVVTVRAKMGYEQVEKQVRKLGLQPIQRPGFEYEFPFWLDVDASHQVVVTRSCWADLSDQVFTKPGPDLGQKIAAWLNSGADPVELPKPQSAPAAAPTQPSLGGDTPEGEFICDAVHEDGVRQCINSKPHNKAHVWEEVKGKRASALVAVEVIADEDGEKAFVAAAHGLPVPGVIVEEPETTFSVKVNS